MFRVTVPGCAPNAPAEVCGLVGYGVDGLAADAEGRLYLWLPNGVHGFTVDGRNYAATVEDGFATARDLDAVAPSRLSITAIRVGADVVELEVETDLSEEDFVRWAAGAEFRVDLRDAPGGGVAETATPMREGAVLSVERPKGRAACFFTVRASN